MTFSLKGLLSHLLPAELCTPNFLSVKTVTVLDLCHRLPLIVTSSTGRSVASSRPQPRQPLAVYPCRSSGKSVYRFSEKLVSSICFPVIPTTSAVGALHRHRKCVSHRPMTKLRYVTRPDAALLVVEKPWKASSETSVFFSDIWPSCRRRPSVASVAAIKRFPFVTRTRPCPQFTPSSLAAPPSFLSFINVAWLRSLSPLMHQPYRPLPPLGWVLETLALPECG